MAISIYEMAHSKTNQTGAVRSQDQKPILGKAAKALADWLAEGGIPAATCATPATSGGDSTTALSKFTEGKALMSSEVTRQP